MNTMGYVAGFLTTVSFLPQVVKVAKTRSTKDISIFMFLIFVLGVSAWTLYGIQLDNFPMILANSVTLVLALIILVYKVIYK